MLSEVLRSYNRWYSFLFWMPERKSTSILSQRQFISYQIRPLLQGFLHAIFPSSNHVLHLAMALWSENLQFSQIPFRVWQWESSFQSECKFLHDRGKSWQLSKGSRSPTTTTVMLPDGFPASLISKKKKFPASLISDCILLWQEIKLVLCQFDQVAWAGPDSAFPFSCSWPRYNVLRALLVKMLPYLLLVAWFGNIATKAINLTSYISNNHIIYLFKDGIYLVSLDIAHVCASIVLVMILLSY